MKTYQIILLIFIGFLIVIQFFPTLENKSDVVPATDLIKSHDEMPSQVATLLRNACYDCHSNNTDYPWYDQVQPIAWFLEGHIQKAKRKLNFNEFQTYSLEHQKKKLEKVRHALQENLMPLKSYKILHSEGRLSQEERQQIIDWIDQELKNY